MNIYPIPDKSREGTNCTNEEYLKLYEASVRSPDEFWGDQARKRLDWFKDFTKTSELDYHKADIKWFLGGEINVSYNCIDRHIKAGKGDHAAIIWENDAGTFSRSYTFNEVLAEVCKIANVLKTQGVKKGDRVVIYMGMIPQLAFTMLACARIGAIHSVIFGGFSQDAIRTRVLDSQARVVVTVDEGMRAGKPVSLKHTVDKGIEDVDIIDRVFVFKHTGAAINMRSGRDVFIDELLETAASTCEAERMQSEDPLFILYTSGSTGKPKGVLHTQAGYLLYASMTHRYVFDIREEDVYFCAADIGWITGHSYIIYGPLANGTTTVMFESTPLYPDASRYWKMIEKYKVNVFYTAPTAIRSLVKAGDEHVKKHDRSSLRVLGTVGEPINKDAWVWYYRTVGEEKCAIVDTWWQTETGGIMIAPLPAANGTKPGSATRPFFGIQPVIVDEAGNEITDPDVSGKLCIKHSWPGQMRTVYGDHERFMKTYFADFPGKYFTGDGAHYDKDGYFWIEGRVDDVLNVSGHRFGTAELESALISSGLAAEVAIVGFPHDIKGEAIYAYVILKDNVESDETTRKNMKLHIKESIGGVAVPDVVQFVPGLPKTRSGKIMRRVLRKIAAGEREQFGDITTLAEPEIVQKIVAGSIKA
ncbi:acetyl-coenzyme A synthetase [Spirochaetota bacterium]|nr:acetyl-coenzyme A synthetase [Spirochaetota bacterium]